MFRLCADGEGNDMAYDPVEQMPSQTLARALLILERFSPERPVWGVRELSRALGISAASTHRLVKTLHAMGYLEQDPETQRYALGPRVAKLAGVYARHNPLPAVATRVFESYTSHFEYNFYLGKLHGFEVVYLAVLDGRGPIKIVVDPGGTTGLHSSALGKILLAHQSDDYIREFIERVGLRAYTERTITDPAVLWQQIAEIRARGYAVNEGEHFDEVGAIGVPLEGLPGQPTLGISLAYPRHLLNEGRIQIDSLVALANEIAGEIKRRLGAAEGPRP